MNCVVIIIIFVLNVLVFTHLVTTKMYLFFVISLIPLMGLMKSKPHFLKFGEIGKIMTNVAKLVVVKFSIRSQN
jgi:hypothetical protein